MFDLTKVEGKPMPDHYGTWWNKNTESFHVFFEHEKYGYVEQTDRSWFRQERYIVWEPSNSNPWYGPVKLPRYPKGV